MGPKRQHILQIATLLLLLISFTFQKQQSQTSKPPFIDPDVVHQTYSEFQFNLILNENRNLPVFFVQYSKDFIRQTVQDMLEGAFRKQPGIAFALLVDCRNFQYNLNKTLNLCPGFDPEKAKQQQQNDLQIQPDKRSDQFFKFDFMAPNPSRIRQKGHQLYKNHDIQNLRQMNTLFNDDFLAKVLRNQIADFVTYIQDTYDMEQFLQTKSEFKTAKKAKILFFDQNLQAPLFLKKLAARLDGRIKVGVTDNFKLAKKYDALIDSILLMEFNFDSGEYSTRKIPIQQSNQLNSILKNQHMARYLKLKKYRDIMLDFQHRDSPIYNMTSLEEINQLMTYGRIIVLQISSDPKKFSCPAVQQISSKYTVMLHYVCFAQKNKNLLQKVGLPASDYNIVHIIDQNLKSTRSFNYDSKNFNIFEYLPQIAPRQKISTGSEAEMCIKTAVTSKRDPVIYWYNQKEHRNTIRLLQYFNSLPEVNSLIYFCQIFLPDTDLTKTYQLKENSLFTMVNPNTQTGQMRKLQFNQALDFVSIKMFLRQLGINQMIKVYEQKLTTNSLTQIKSAQDLTKQCFSKQCIVALMATNKFRYDSQMTTLKQLKLQLSQSGFNFVWIDGTCHWDIAKQLKLLSKTQKQIDRTYLFYYKEKSNQYALMESIVETKFWVKKDAKKWIRNVKRSGAIKRLKFGIDIEDKKCDKKNVQKKQQQKKANTGRAKPNRPNKEVKQQQL